MAPKYRVKTLLAHSGEKQKSHYSRIPDIPVRVIWGYALYIYIYIYLDACGGSDVDEAQTVLEQPVIYHSKITTSTTSTLTASEAVEGSISISESAADAPEVTEAAHKGYHSTEDVLGAAQTTTIARDSSNDMSEVSNIELGGNKRGLHNKTSPITKSARRSDELQKSRKSDGRSDEEAEDPLVACLHKHGISLEDAIRRLSFQLAKRQGIMYYSTGKLFSLISS